MDTLPPEEELTRAMSHSLMAGGKRLRPVLCLAAAQALGRDPKPALPAACAIEMIHTYSLIHDDLPAMDDDDLRRGVPTCHKAFSEATAILAGDALLTLAFSVLAAPPAFFSHLPSPGNRLKLVEIISRAAGPEGMVAGQMMDMQAMGGNRNTTSVQKNKTAPEHRLTRLHHLKTGCMIQVSVTAGGLSVGAETEQIRPLVTYAEKVGLAFQVVDDILNVEGDPAVMGKAVGSDANLEKLTYPALLGLDASKKMARSLVDDACDALSALGTPARPLVAIADYVVNRKR